MSDQTKKAQLTQPRPLPSTDCGGPPTIHLSIDLDQRWGLRSLGPTAHGSDSALWRMPELVHQMLIALDRRRIASTWFMPAALTCGSWDEYFAVSPDDPSGLADNYRITTAFRDLDPTGRLHFMPSVIEELVAGDTHEIGTLGFSALPLDLAGVTVGDVLNELATSVTHLKRVTGRRVRSFAFHGDHLGYPDAVRARGGLEPGRASRQTAPEHTGSTIDVFKHLDVCRVGWRAEQLSHPWRGDDSDRSTTRARALRAMASDLLHRDLIRRDRSTVADGALSPIGFSVHHDVTPAHWNRQLRQIAQGTANLAVGRDLHIRWATRPLLSRDFDVDVSSARFYALLAALIEGADRSGATISTMTPPAVRRVAR